ncbi:MAG: phosphoribosylglycinamide formyltransferase [Cyclobacteriaceae bacterium]|jgi:phosphoribosylglycinamide formyltransferase-1|nr:phosphoribosylglycinamide formyltransferase [Flammeovirgaceae bacterium]
MKLTSRLALFASGSGSNAEVIIRHFKNHPQIEVALVLTNNATAGVIERAQKLDVQTKFFTREQFRESEPILQLLREYEITHIVLAGFLLQIPTSLIQEYPSRIINIHPSLLPKFGGKGMYGMKVHEAVKQSGETETGITIHEVNEHYDDGRVLFQAKCKVEATDTPEQIARNVQALEHHHFPLVIEKWILSTK